MQTLDWLKMGYLFAVVLVPLIPAYLIYSTLPSQTNVSGPFKGLTIKLSGAFGGYFLLVLSCFGFAYFVLTPAEPTFEVWMIEGKITSLNKDGETVSNLDTKLSILPAPPYFLMESDGRFKLIVIVPPGHVEGSREFPVLYFGRPGYEPEVRFVNRQKATFDDRLKRASFPDPIVLEPLPESLPVPDSDRNQ